MIRQSSSLPMDPEMARLPDTLYAGRSAVQSDNRVQGGHATARQPLSSNHSRGTAALGTRHSLRHGSAEAPGGGERNGERSSLRPSEPCHC